MFKIILAVCTTVYLLRPRHVHVMVSELRL